MANVIRLFDEENETYTNEGNDLETEIHYLLAPILDRCKKADFALRDVAYIITSHVDVECSVGILFRNAEKRKAAKNG